MFRLSKIKNGVGSGVGSLPTQASCFLIPIFSYILVMLWSQIKLTSYDFSDLHITGEFDNHPGTGRFFRNLY